MPKSKTNGMTDVWTLTRVYLSALADAMRTDPEEAAMAMQVMEESIQRLRDGKKLGD